MRPYKRDNPLGVNHAFQWLSATALVTVLIGSLGQAQQPSFSTSSSSGPPTVQVHHRTVRVPVVEGTDIRFRRLSTVGGLSQTRVEHIVQDDQGFMWFGTQFGLNRYDGIGFRVFTPNPANANSISCGSIRALFKDRSNMLWIGCDQFLDRFDPTTETFTHYRLTSSESNGLPVTVHNIVQDREGTLWLGTGSGLYGVDPTTGRVIHHYLHDPGDSSSLNQNEVQPIRVDWRGKLLVADGNDIEQFNQETGRVMWRLPLPGLTAVYSSPPRDVKAGGSHSAIFVWVDYITNWEDSGLALLNADTRELTYYSFYDQKSGAVLHLSVSAMFEESDGSFWLGGNGGLLSFAPDTGRAIRYRHYPDDPESLDDDRVIALEQDREGNMWIGLHAREPNVFATRKPSFAPVLRETLVRNPLGEYMVSAIYEDREGAVWVGASGNLIRTDRKTGRHTTYTLNDDVISITGDSDGDIWVGTGYRGLYRLDPRTSKVTRFPLEPSSSAAYHNQILRIFTDRRGVTWLATKRGLLEFDRAAGYFTAHRRSRTDEYYDIAEDQSGRLWLGGNGGLQRYDPATGRFTAYEHQLDNPKSLSDNAVSSVLVDHLGNVWAATYNGLAKLDQKSATFTNYYANDGLPSSRVSCALEDRHGLLWLSTARGVSRFDPLKKTFTNYSVADGLPGLDLTGWVTCFNSPSGEMFFGGFSGATGFFPDKVVDSDYVPPVVFTDFLLSGRPVNIGDKSPLIHSINYTNRVTLPHDQHDFSLQFAALTFSSPWTVRYRYRLDRIDSEWHESGADQRFVTYPELGTGKYTFRVEASTGHGGWNPPGATLYIEILPPWWSTWWFRLLVAVAFIFTALFLYRFRLHEVTARLNLRFEERLAERMRIARDFHDTLLQSFQGVLLNFHAVTYLVSDRPEVTHAIETVMEQARHAITEGRNAVEGLRASRHEGTNLETAIRDWGRELAANQSQPHCPEFLVNIQGARRGLGPIAATEIHYIADEALRNAFRHAHAQRVEVELFYHKREFRLRVRDNGRGIAPELLQGGRIGHYGITGMHERARLAGGRLVFWSEVGSGTEIELTIPASLAYAKVTLPGSPTFIDKIRSIFS